MRRRYKRKKNLKEKSQNGNYIKCQHYVVTKISFLKDVRVTITEPVTNHDVLFSFIPTFP